MISASFSFFSVWSLSYYSILLWQSRSFRGCGRLSSHGRYGVSSSFLQKSISLFDCSSREYLQRNTITLVNTITLSTHLGNNFQLGFLQRDRECLPDWRTSCCRLGRLGGRPQKTKQRLQGGAPRWRKGENHASPQPLSGSEASINEYLSRLLRS